MHSLTPLAANTIVLSWLFVGLAIISVIIVLARNRIRHIGSRPFDWCVFSALVVGLVLVSINTWAIVSEGASEHRDKLSHHELYSAAKSLIVNEALWSLSNATIRVAACLFLFELFEVFTECRIAVLSTLVLSVIHGLGSLLEILLICRPLKAQWDPNVQGACSNQMTSFIEIEVTGLIIDLPILVVPAIAIRGLDLSWRKKLTVFCVIDAGAIVLVITALRLKALHLATSADFTYSKSYFSLLSAVGCMLNIVLVATPAFIEIFKRFILGEALTPRGPDADPTLDADSTAFRPSLDTRRGNNRENIEKYGFVRESPWDASSIRAQMVPHRFTIDMGRKGNRANVCVRSSTW